VKLVDDRPGSTKDAGHNRRTEMDNSMKMESLEIADLDLDVLPGGASEPVLHVAAAVAVIIAIGYAGPAW
jgi:hypothetical protein